MAQWQRVHIFDELARYGCFVDVLNPSECNTIEEANEKLILQVQYDQYDLFMTPYGSKELFIDTLLHIKKSGLPTMLICFDNLIEPYMHKSSCRFYDLVWLTSRETEHMFINWGAKTVFVPYAANPFLFSLIHSKEINNAVFIGTPFGSRAKIINHLADNLIDVCVFSSTSSTGVQNQKQSALRYVLPFINYMRFPIGRKVILGAVKQKVLGSERLNISNNYISTNQAINLSFSEMNEVYSAYALSLSSTAWRNTGIVKSPVDVINLRSFEIPMCGGLQFCRYSNELAGYFKEDKEIVFYRTNEEMIDKARFYLKPEHDSLRIKMKKNARKRAENEHTWFLRFSKAFGYLGLRL